MEGVSAASAASDIRAAVAASASECAAVPSSCTESRRAAEVNWGNRATARHSETQRDPLRASSKTKTRKTHSGDGAHAAGCDARRAHCAPSRPAVSLLDM
jgi:hypothetical protein